MSSAQQGPSSAEDCVFHTVRIPRDGRKKITMMKFGNLPVDFSKVGEQPVRIERENNLKEYKSANDLDQLPKFGAGSEYGRDLKEESRRKKFGIMIKKYNPEDQPWQLKIGSGKTAKRYKGVREGSISDNTSYYMFTKHPDGAFEAYPVEEWYNFSPVVQYKYLNSEQAEEEFERRDKILNHWMLKYKYNKPDAEVEDEEEEKKKGGKKKTKKKNLQLTDMEDWDDLDMSDDEGSDEEMDEDGNPIKKKKKTTKAGKKRRNAKQNSDDEAVEESDEGDFDDKEVDYMSDSGSDSDLSGGEKDEKKVSKYDDMGVDMEAGLRNILDSDAEDDEEEQPKEENDDDIDDKDDKKDVKKEKGPDDSSSSSSEDDSDIEKDAERASKLFLTGDRKIKKEKKEKTESEQSPVVKKEIKQETSQPSQSATPSDKSKEKGLKRKVDRLSDRTDSKSPLLKKHRSEESEGALEEDLRRYLMRKPMTTKDLLQKFKAKKLAMTNEKLTQVIVQLLKKINPDRTTINKKLYLSLKKDEG